MDQKTIREIMMKIQASSHEYILNFEKEWNEAVALVKASKKDLSRIMITKRAG